jgi:hypothetical protein
LILADWYSKNTLQLKFWNNVKLTHVLTEILKSSVDTKYCNSVGELISKFPLQKLGGTRRISNFYQLWGATYSFEVTDCYVTKMLGSLGHLFLVTIVDTTVLPNNELTAQQNQTDWNHKIKQIPWCRIAGLGVFAQILCILGITLVVSYLLIHNKGATWRGCCGLHPACGQLWDLDLVAYNLQVLLPES